MNARHESLRKIFAHVVARNTLILDPHRTDAEDDELRLALGKADYNAYEDTFERLTLTKDNVPPHHKHAWRIAAFRLDESF